MIGVQGLPLETAEIIDENREQRCAHWSDRRNRQMRASRHHPASQGFGPPSKPQRSR
jgi:hypothetical protein